MSMREKKKFDVVSFVMEYESGMLDDDSIIDGFQHLINDGSVWSLQGHYGRTAQALITAGLCTIPNLKKDNEHASN